MTRTTTEKRLEALELQACCRRIDTLSIPDTATALFLDEHAPPALAHRFILGREIDPADQALVAWCREGARCWLAGIPHPSINAGIDAVGDELRSYSDS